MIVDRQRPNPDAISAAIKADTHLSLIWNALDVGLIDFALVTQQTGKTPFTLPKTDKPLICIVGDDMETSLGPDAYDTASLSRIAERCELIIIMSAMSRRLYEGAAYEAVQNGRSSLIVETTVAQEIAWTNFVREAQPLAAHILCTLKGGEA